MPAEPDHTPSPTSSHSRKPVLPVVCVEAQPIVPDYRMLHRIGKGAFGEVWLARNALGTLRAVKVIHRHRAAFINPTEYERELIGVRNFEPISREHPGLVDLLDVGVNEAGGYFYYAMELADDANAECGMRRAELQATPKDEEGRSRMEDGAAESPSIPHSQSAILAPETYSPLTLSARLRAEGRLPLAECLRLGLALTDALEFLHQRGLIHRDIKPSNIIFVGGVPKLADVGTVTHVSEAKTMVGTEGFQAPEGPGKPQADLYSLGKVLYEISTGKDRQRFPEPLTKLADLPDREKWKEFNAVVDKACQPDPTRRYPSTTELRGDLLDIQHDRSVRKRWIREKRFKQAVWLLAVLTVLAAVASALYVQQLRLRMAAERTAKAEQATLKARLDGEEKQRKEAEKGLALLELEKTIRPPHVAGWSTKAWQIASNAAAKFGFDTNLQSQATASLAGLDAKLLFQTNGIGGSSVAFSLDGKHVLYGSLSNSNQTAEPGKAHLLDLDTKTLTAFPAPGEGPVAFLPDGTPVQFSADTNNRLALWIVGPRVPPGSGTGVPPVRTGTETHGQDARATTTSDDPVAMHFFTLTNGETFTNVGALAMTPDGAFVAASGVTTSNRTLCAVWNGTNGNLLLAADSLSRKKGGAGEPPDSTGGSPVLPTPQFPMNALTLTPDGSLLAAGNEDGQVFIWRVPRASPSGSRREEAPSSNAERGERNAASSQSLLTSASTVEAPDSRAPFNRISAGRLPICSLAFGHDYVLDLLRPDTECQWLLAIGDSGGGVTIWEVPAARPRWHCQGEQYERDALAFSPDGTLLVSAGRAPVFIWDTATGREVFRLEWPDAMTGIAFSRDGARLAGSSQHLYAPGRIIACSLDNGRGVRTLHGLSRPVTKVIFSADAKHVAAVSHDWQVGIWDLPANRLVHVFNVPPGLFTADNAGLAFSPDGSEFAFMAGTNAMLLRVGSGEVVKNWRIPPGRVEELAFDPDGRLYAFHFESADTAAETLSRPRIARIRELLREGGTSLLRELPEFNFDVRGAAWAPDASFILIVGTNLKDGQTNRCLTAVSPHGKTNLWTLPQDMESWATASFVLDAAGALAYLARGSTADAGTDLVDAVTGNRIRSTTSQPAALSSASKLLIGRAASAGWTIRSLADDSLLAVIQSWESNPVFLPVLSRDGWLLAWGNEDGTVSVCDLTELPRRLDQIRLGWARRGPETNSRTSTPAQ